jgi:ADP-heptose:LPS heptosyltransferase
VSIDKLLSPTQFDNILNYQGLNSEQSILMLRRKKYDLVIQLPQYNAPFWRLGRDLFFFRLIASAGWGWEIGSVSFFRKVQEKYIAYDTELVRLSKLALRNNLVVDINDFPLNITTQDVLFVDQQYNQLALCCRKIIGVIVGAKRPQNRWPINYFRQVVNYFSSEYNIVIIGGKEDKELASEVCIHPNVFNLCGLFTPMQSAAALKKCCVVLSNDTGPMHLSYMLRHPYGSIIFLA